MTAIPSAPARMASHAFSRVIPPMATSGSRDAARIPRIPSIPQKPFASGFDPVGKTGLAAR
jgi:hypothetical protein